MNAQQISWLPEEVRNHIAQLERDLDRVTAERDHAQGITEKLPNVSVPQPCQMRAELAEASLKVAREQISALRARVAELDESLHLTNGTADLALHHRDIAEQRNAELEAALDDLLGCPTVTDLATCPNGDPSRIDEAPEWQAVLQISCAWTRYKKLKVLASAESATPAKQEAAR